MRVLLVDFDSKIPNLALMKESARHKAAGHEVGFVIENPDLIIASVIFQKNRAQAFGLKEMFPRATIRLGGPGMYPDCGSLEDAELLKPDYDLYPSTYSQGFTTRGCIRHCPFCLVPQMEGALRIAQHPREFHDDRFRTCMIMDNNLLAAPGPWVREVLEWFRDVGVGMDATQGFDARLLTETRAGMLKDIRHPKGIHFAWDNPEDEPTIMRTIGLLKDAGFNLKHDVSFYVLVGYNTTFEEDLHRCNHLREMRVNSYVMRYHKEDRRLNRLAKWANRRWSYWKGPFTPPHPR
jgi:hypothetical protein